MDNFDLQMQDPMSENDNDNPEAEQSDSDELPVEHKCELCGTEFVTPTSLKIHRLKCVKMHKEQQIQQQNLILKASNATIGNQSKNVYF